VGEVDGACGRYKEIEKTCGILVRKPELGTNSCKA